MQQPQLTLGPVLFNWNPDTWRDLYYRIADEAPVDTVYIGEVVCSKRAPFFTPHYADVAERLAARGKNVVFSSLAEIMIRRERKMTSELCAGDDFMIEANDSVALYHLRGAPHAVGPYVNAYNEETLSVLAANGAVHFTMPPELPRDSLAEMAKAAKRLGVSLEVQVYGRVPLALSARCYHARAHGRVKDNCQFVCEQDPDGMELQTLDEKEFLVVNGVQTLSYTCLNMLQELHAMLDMGITAFRISPHSHDMVETASVFRDVLDKKISPADAVRRTAASGPGVPFSNGFFYRKPGYQWVENLRGL